jgi:hypothetical protein
MTYNLKLEVQRYLKLEDEWIEILFNKYKKGKIHMSLAATQKQFRDLENRYEQKRKYFKSKLIS